MNELPNGHYVGLRVRVKKLKGDCLDRYRNNRFGFNAWASEKEGVLTDQSTAKSAEIKFADGSFDQGHWHEIEPVEAAQPEFVTRAEYMRGGEFVMSSHKRLSRRIAALEAAKPAPVVAENAKTAPVSDDAPLLRAFVDLLAWADTQWCEHSSTHRGGNIWTICDDCGRKWADDEGGAPISSEPPAIKAARAPLADALIAQARKKVVAKPFPDDAPLRFGERIRSFDGSPGIVVMPSDENEDGLVTVWLEGDTDSYRCDPSRLTRITQAEAREGVR